MRKLVLPSLVFVATLSACTTGRQFHASAQQDAGGSGGAGGNGGAGGKATGGSGGKATGGTGGGRTDGSLDVAHDAAAEAACGSASDPKNCGTCGHDCMILPNVSPSASGVECRAGVCYVPASACTSGYGHCSSRADDGCETSLLDSQTCGSCGMKCASAVSLCASTATGPQCSASCAAPTPDVCVSTCVDLKSDPKNCGTCGHDCTTLPNVSPGATGVTCSSGACVVPAAACASGFGHCSTRPDDGCETDLKTQSSCGACGKTCVAPTALCSMNGTTFTCSSSCASPSPDLCTTKCVDLKSDPTNCGACSHDCTALPNVKPGATGVECRTGVCYVPPAACASGYAHCSTQPNDGCEAVLTSPAHCGSCSLICSGTTPLCSTQTQPASCMPSCSGSSPDVCGTQCVNRLTDPKNCGTCGHACTALPNVKPGATAPAVQCVAGACVIQPAGCASGFGHCTSTPDNGCETDLTRPQTCGSCTNACTAPTGLCSTTGGSPMCSSSCTSPTPDLCGSKCVDKKTDPTNCGTCGHDCTALPHLKSGASVSCNGSGGCVVSACAAGYANCSTGTSDTDGCETATNTNTNCGGCGVACSIANGTGNCSTGTCQKICNNGFYMCNGACIANTAQCGGSCGALGYQACGAVCIPNSACCAPAAAAVHNVDGVGGTDAPDHGGPGACAYKTIGYALAHGTGQIALALATYSNEAWPVVLTGSQQLRCNPNGIGRATIKMVQSDGGSVVQLTGHQNELHDCIINGNNNNVDCVDITASGSSSAAPQLLTSLDIGDCSSSGVEVGDNVTNVTVQDSTFHGDGYGVNWDGSNTGQMLSNSFTGDTNWAANCDGDGSPGLSGSGNMEEGGEMSCAGCSGGTLDCDE